MSLLTDFVLELLEGGIEPSTDRRLVITFTCRFVALVDDRHQASNIPADRGLRRVNHRAER